MLAGALKMAIKPGLNKVELQRLHAVGNLAKIYEELFADYVHYRQIENELNIERYTLRKDGAIGFSHPQGIHDDVFWSIALAVYAIAEMQPEPYLAVIPRT